MRLKSPRLWIMVLSALAVLWLGVIDLRRTAPGPLSSVHQQEPVLTGWRSCSQCHGGWLSSIGLAGARSPHETMADACRECHPAIATQIASGTGLHGIQGRDKATVCATCHSEHHGPEFAVVNRQSFLRAGISSRDAFRHDTIGFAMDGRHLEQPCVACHAHADQFTLRKGAARYVGLSQDCATCHQDPHLGQMALPCATCHDQVAFPKVATADHDRHLPLVGGHADLGCRSCHAQGTPHALEAAGRSNLPPRACADCHASPHKDAFVRGVAALAGVSERAVCGTCHGPEQRRFRVPELTTTPAQHAASGFPLDLPHDAVPCARCHAPEAPAFAARYPGRGAESCEQCHADAHAGQFRTGTFAGQGCIACHDRQRFVPHTFTPRDHQRTGLPLTGRHLDTECARCHPLPERGGPRQFHGTDLRCEACHPDAHDGFFGPMAALLDGGRFGACAACHTTNRFGEQPPGGFAHGRFTRFAVDGAHAEAGCESCHEPTATRDRAGRAFGRIAARFGVVPEHGHTCVPCHRDPHQGRFDDPRLPRTVEGGLGCARCHQGSTFRVLARPFAHGQWTGYALDGAHGRSKCGACHAPLRSPDAHGRTWQPARGRACADCHADPHAGQFLVDGRTTCERCHQSAERWQTLVFDHQKDARFPLDGAHRKVACAGCHKPVQVGTAEVTRYRPLGLECVSCHGAHEDPLRRRKQGP